MAESVNNEAAIEENIESRESVTINADIKEVMKLRGFVENFNKKVKHWIGQTLKLFQSNDNIEISYDKLLMKVFDIETKISKNMEIFITKKQELKDLQNIKANISHKQWDDFLSEIGKYADNFHQWYMEYSTDVLMKEIKNHQEECEKVAEELAILKEEVNDMQKRYDTEYIEANVNANNLSNINTVISDIKTNNNLTHVVRLTEAKLNKIESKIKHNKMAINEYKLKEKTTYSKIH